MACNSSKPLLGVTFVKEVNEFAPISTTGIFHLF